MRFFIINILCILSVVGCAQQPTTILDVLREKTYFYSPVDEYERIWQVLIFTDDEMSLYLGLMNEEEQFLGDWYPFVVEKNALIVELENHRASIKLLKKGGLVLEYDDGEHIVFLDNIF